MVLLITLIFRLASYSAVSKLKPNVDTGYREY